MALYNNQLGMNDLFRNPSLSSVLPQFEGGTAHHNISFAEMVRKVTEYIKGLLNAVAVEERHLKVNGKHPAILQKLRGAVPVMEQFFSSLGSVRNNLRNNTKLYTPYASSSQLEGIQSPSEKLKAMQTVLDNINYNKDFNSLNSISNLSPNEFNRRQQAWEKKVGYREPTGRR